jgi:hypothetical protein
VCPPALAGRVDVVPGRGMSWDNSLVEHHVEGAGNVPRRALGPMALDPASRLLTPAVRPSLPRIVDCRSGCTPVDVVFHTKDVHQWRRRTITHGHSRPSRYCLRAVGLEIGLMITLRSLA